MSDNEFFAVISGVVALFALIIFWGIRRTNKGDSYFDRHNPWDLFANETLLEYQNLNFSKIYIKPEVNNLMEGLKLKLFDKNGCIARIDAPLLSLVTYYLTFESTHDVYQFIKSQGIPNVSRILFKDDVVARVDLTGTRFEVLGTNICFERGPTNYMGDKKYEVRKLESDVDKSVAAVVFIPSETLNCRAMLLDPNLSPLERAIVILCSL